MATTIDPKSWVLAPVFVPKIRTTLTNIEPDKNDSEITLTSTNEHTTADDEINEQIPQKSYAQVVGHSTETNQIISSLSESAEKLCPYTRTLESDLCPYNDECQYVHGDLCDMCGWYCLHPTDLEQRKIHQNVRGNIKFVLCILQFFFLIFSFLRPCYKTLNLRSF